MKPQHPPRYDVTHDVERVRAAFARGDRDIPVLLRTMNVNPGDVAVFTALLRDIHVCYPSRFRTAVQVDENRYGHNKFVVHANPYIAPMDSFSEPPPILNMEYGSLVNRSNQDGRHFIWGYFDCFNFLTGADVRLTEFRPDLHMDPDELGTAPAMAPDEPYWVLVAGGKGEYASKLWGWPRWATVVAALKDRVKFVQVGSEKDDHEPIPWAVNVVGQTSVRELMGLIYYSSGVACGVTFAMHCAAGFNKPCVVVGYGGEAKHWEAYDEEGRQRNAPGDTRTDFIPHRYFFSDWPCDRRERPGWGCWKSKVLAGEPRETCAHVNQGVVMIQDEDGKKTPHLARAPECVAAVPWKDVAEAIREEARWGPVSAIASATSANGPALVSVLKGVYPYARRALNPTMHVFANMGCRGGGEHSTITLMGALKARGVRVEFWPLNRIDPSWELDLYRATDQVHETWRPPTPETVHQAAYPSIAPGDHAYIYFNDAVVSFCKVSDFWKRAIDDCATVQMCLNFTLGPMHKETWLSEKLTAVFFLNSVAEAGWKSRVEGTSLARATTIVLPPAVALDQFLAIERA